VTQGPSKSSSSRKRKVAILGGGVGAIKAAYAITQLPGWSERYDITVYQMGWRLGGKGASGRNLAKNGRIEEHGLHIWAGFYDNSFRLMRDCYEQLVSLGLRSADAPLGTLEKAFKPLNHFFLSEDIPQPDGSIQWQPWRIDFEPNSAVPGEGGEVPSPFAFFQMFVEFLVQTLAQLEAAAPSGVLQSAPTPALQSGVRAALLRAGVDTSAGPAHGGRLVHLALELANAVHPNPHRHQAFHSRAMIELFDGFTDWLQVIRPERLDESPEIRRLYYILELGSATARGMVSDRVFTNGFDSIDAWECSEWLLRHGASEKAVDSAVFRGCYDYVFGYPGGNVDHRGVGAGTAMRGLFRLAWTYKGALFYKMQAGMGDTIFAPYYLVLRERGVRFEFFHAVTGLRLSGDKESVAEIELVRQAAPIGGNYDPLIPVQNLLCWPSEPLWDRLEEGEALQKAGINFEDESRPPSGDPLSLRRGHEFDDVVLGISIGSLPSLTKELTAVSPQWADMLSGIPTVSTQAMQLWLTVPSAEYGWKKLVEEFNPKSSTRGALQTVMTSFVEPLDTWADMSDLLVREDFDPDDRPWSIAYFCSPRSEDDVGKPLSEFKDACRAWMSGHLVQIWPAMQGRNGGFAYSTLHDPTGARGGRRLDWQYFRVNDYGSERYVLSVPNSVGRRLRSDQSGFDNLYLAGDWTLNGINAGCVEAATNSGLEAARGLTGADIKIVGAQDTLPGAGPTPPGMNSRAATAAPWPLSMAYSMGRMDSWVNFLALPADEVASLLPPGLELAPQSVTANGTHPVTILLNQQLSVRPSFLPNLPYFSGPYLEAIVAVGYVRHKLSGHEPEGLFAYLPVLYLNNWIDTAAGRFFYGLNKQMADIRMVNNRYAVSKSGKMLLSAKLFDRGRIGQPDSFPAFETVRGLLSQPMIAPRQVGRWQYSLLAFDFDEASIIPAFGTMEVGEGFCRALRPGTYRRHALGQGDLGSFRLWTDWSLSNPLDSSRIKKLSDQRALYVANHPHAAT
jgi:uncharacterized protein with NAD-binding domain and iron-sulfur cluster